jgi:hypothetical protein
VMIQSPDERMIPVCVTSTISDALLFISPQPASNK